MKVGVVNFYRKQKGVKYLLDALELLGVEYDLYNYSNNLKNIIKESTINKWIFSGSDRDVLKDDSPQVPIDILNLSNKKFLMICYSMESVLYQLNFPVVRCEKVAREVFELGNKVVFRNHYAFTPAKDVKKPVRLLESCKGEAMTALYKNACLVQWHPERTPDGIIYLFEWIKR